MIVGHGWNLGKRLTDSDGDFWIASVPLRDCQSLCDRTSAANEFAVGPERMTSEREGGSEGLERGGKNGGEGGRD